MGGVEEGVQIAVLPVPIIPAHAVHKVPGSGHGLTVRRLFVPVNTPAKKLDLSLFGG
jgi:hypothetical protein